MTPSATARLDPCRSAWKTTTFILIIFHALGSTALAQSAPADSGDTAWLLVSSAFVMLMLPGLALFYAGMVRAKNVLSSLMHSFAALALIGIQWVLLGYSLSFAEGSAFVGGFGHFLLTGMGEESLSDTIPTYAFVMFQGMFAIITPALISGALAERMKFSAYLVFIALWATLVYDPIAHWVWGGGWLGAMGALDYAGGTVVHLSSGVSALALVMVLG
ncbi:MAG: ammonium transporter, partial [Bacteroidetes bacterium]